jgi:hypothetical protein
LHGIHGFVVKDLAEAPFEQLSCCHAAGFAGGRGYIGSVWRDTKAVSKVTCNEGRRKRKQKPTESPKKKRQKRND